MKESEIPDMNIMTHMVAISVLFFTTGLILQAAEQKVPSASALPKVLIIGDSISIGYTPHVAKKLKGKAVVRHNPGNAQDTATGLKRLDQWIGKERWNVIHFNWGLWDLCYRNPESKEDGHRDKIKGKVTATPETYAANLEKLVRRLEKTGATLIWANTTVVPEGEAGRFVGDDNKYNEAAAIVMKKHGIKINDLNSLSRTFPASSFEAPGNVHYSVEGYKKLAERVADMLEAALKGKS